MYYMKENKSVELEDIPKNKIHGVFRRSIKNSHIWKDLMMPNMFCMK